MPIVPSGEGWFTWNDVDCRDYGIYVLTQPTFIRPAERLSSVTIPGKSGSLTLREGPDVYDDISLSCMCVIDKPDEMIHSPGDPTSMLRSRISYISSWLKGGGTVKFANRPDGFYYANIANQISFDRVLRDNPHKVFSVQFQCHPFFYLDIGQQPFYIKSAYYTRDPSVDPIMDYSISAGMVNYGTVYSDPLIVVYGKREEAGYEDSGVDLYVNLIRNSTRIEISHTYIDFVGAPHGYSYVRLDSDQKIAYADSPSGSQRPYRLMGSLVYGDFPILPATGDYEYLEIELDDDYERPARYLKVTPRWRCL